jgi:AraC-like DNA-binding protein
VVPGALHSTLAHPPLTCWIVQEGRVELTFSHGPPPLHGRPGDALFLPIATRTHRITPGTRLLSCRFHLTTPSGPLPWRQAQPFRRRDGIEPLRTAAEQLERLTARLFGTDPTHNRLPQPSPTPVDPDLALQWTAGFADWLREFLRLTRSAGWEPVFAATEHSTVAHSLTVMSNGGWRNGFKGQDLADHFGISLSQFKRRFREETGLPFKQWLDQERLRRVTLALEAGGEPLKGIAYDHGFSSPSHFSAWFRRRTGVSPLTYRNSAVRVGI